MNVEAWLKSLGLEQYAAAFHENDVDAEVLPTLTAEELKDIGVSSIRHRRRLLEAIAALRLQATPGETPIQVSSSPTLTEPTGNTAERRPLSVMFCDLIGPWKCHGRNDNLALMPRRCTCWWTASD
jgi:hypothetical protein